MGYYASELIQSVAEDLLDYSAAAADQYVRWTQAEHLANLNAGQRQIVAWKPDANALPLIYKLVAGTEQRIPDGSASYLSPAAATHPEGIQLIRPVKNMGTSFLFSSPALAIGSDTSAVATATFSYVINGTAYSKGAVAAGTEPGNDEIAATKYGAVAFDIGANGTIDVIEATGQVAAQFATEALAIAALPAVAAGHIRMGYITATKSDGPFVFGTTALNDANSTVVYYTAATTPGSAIEMGDIGIMDGLLPGWHMETGNATVQTVMYDPQDPTRFYVYPPQPASGQGWVELIIATKPADVVAAVGPPVSYAVAISLRDIFRQPLEDYMLYRAYLKDAAISPYAAQRSQVHLNACLTALGRKDLIQRQYSPSRPVVAAEGDQQ